MNWSPATGSESVYVSFDNLVTGPVSGSTAIAGWDLQIESSNSGSALKFGFPTATGSQSFYGIMRLPGTSSGAGASIPEGSIVQQTSSFAYNAGAVSFGDGAGEWRLNAVNIFGFRFRSALSSQVMHYGYGRIFIGATPGQFRLVELSYQDTGGAAIFVVPSPGVLTVLAGAATVGSRRRRR